MAAKAAARRVRNMAGCAAYPAGLLMLADRYHELMVLRTEGLEKYGARLMTGFFAPPHRLSWPELSLRELDVPFVKLGPVYFGDNPPIRPLVETKLASLPGSVSILEIGPGKGTLAGCVLKRYADRIQAYYGLERDKNVEGPYQRIDDIGEIQGTVGLVIASEVAEHMPADVFFSELLVPAARKMSADGILILGTPNPLAPTAIFLDFSHVQAYPWYDLYAILRLEFNNVDVYRTRYVASPGRLLSLLPRIVMTRLLEQDWCEGLCCVATGPRTAVEST